MPNSWRKRFGSVRAGTSEPTPTTVPGRSIGARGLRIMARSSNELNMIARTARKSGGNRLKPDCGIAFGRWHENSRAIGRADAVIRVPVAIAEEDERSRTDPVPTRDDDAGTDSSVLRYRATSARRRASGLFEHPLREPAERRRIALVDDGKRSTATPLTSSRPAGSSLAHVT